MEDQQEQHPLRPNEKPGEGNKETNISKGPENRPFPRFPVMDPVHFGMVDTLNSAIGININTLMPRIDSMLNIDILRSSLDLVRIPNIDILRSSLDLVRIPNIDILRSNLFPTLIHPKAQEAATLGWIPHYTLPMDLLEDKEGEDLNLAIMDHYRERWPRVRKQLELATDGYLIDEHSKETMKEALEAHESKLYRMVPPTLLVGIEGAVRNHLNKNLVGQGVDVKGRIVTGAGDLPISAARNLSSEMVQYETVENHLYKHVDNEADRADLSENPIPNRHAAIHGLVPYSSEKSSLNSIFLADFVFHVITEIKRQKISEAARILRNHIPTMN